MTYDEYLNELVRRIVVSFQEAVQELLRAIELRAPIEEIIALAIKAREAELDEHMIEVARIAAGMWL
jgi:hypothetical protein